MSLSEAKNYYDLLGVSRTSTSEEIRSAYKELARVYHPDSNFYDEIIQDSVGGDSVELFKELTAAYHTLTNVERRKEYDRSLPKGLKDWEAPTEDVTKSPSGAIFRTPGKGLRTNVASPSGMFGKQPPKSKFEEVFSGEPTAMSEIIRTRRSFFARLFRLFA